MLLKGQNISKVTSTSEKLSERAILLINKNVNDLKLSELAFLIRESIGIGVCIPIALNKLRKEVINLSMLHRDDNSANQRELVRELILLDEWHWERNLNAFKELKKIIGIQIDYITLPRNIKNKFKTLVPDELKWNENSINSYNGYMNDTRMGVMAAYSMVISIKRAILNGNSIKYELFGESRLIDDLDLFKQKILDSIKLNSELKELLKKEKRIKD